MKSSFLLFGCLLFLAGGTVRSQYSADISAATGRSAGLHTKLNADGPVSIAAAMKGYDYSRTLTGESMLAEALAAPPVNPYSKKSPFLAGLMSLAIPGAGQVYAESYWTAVPFVAAEVAGWYLVIDQNRKGDDATLLFEAYADQNWDVAKYAGWLNDNADDFDNDGSIVHIDIDPNESLLPWDRVDWQQMNTTEMAVAVFSHKLPPHGDQQYYEMIGKYNQYSYGWIDKTGGNYWNISDMFREYAGLRGDANEYYDTADTIVNLIILNHILSGLEAAWAAARFNKFVELYSDVKVRPKRNGYAELIPTATFSYRF